MDTRTLAVVLLFLACCTVPALAATDYIDSSPKLNVFIAGANEFTPGQDVTITVIIQNSGLNSFKFVDWGTIERDDLPNTAKLVTVQLLPGTAPVTIKTDPQTIGDIPGTGTARFGVNAKIADDAPGGDYELPLLIHYKYLTGTMQAASDQIQFQYREVNQTVPLTIRIKPLLRIKVLAAIPVSLDVGTEGYLNLTIENDGSDDGKMATVRITRSGSSPIIPTDSSVFVGDFPAGGVVVCSYKVSVSSYAEEQTYPVDVSVMYTDYEGSIVTSATETVGVPIGGKAGFGIVTSPPSVAPGQSSVIAVGYKNTGRTTVHNAQVRISVVPPFSSSDDTAYLGDLKPGDVATAQFGINAADTADPGDYTFDSIVRYRDALDNSQISDTIRVPVNVAPRLGSAGPLANPFVLFLIAAGIITAGYYVLVMRKKR